MWKVTKKEGTFNTEVQLQFWYCELQLLIQSRILLPDLKITVC